MPLRAIDVDIAQDLGGSGGKIISSHEFHELNQLEGARALQDTSALLDLLGKELSSYSPIWCQNAACGGGGRRELRRCSAFDHDVHDGEFCSSWRGPVVIRGWFKRENWFLRPSRARLGVPKQPGSGGSHANTKTTSGGANPRSHRRARMAQSPKANQARGGNRGLSQRGKHSHWRSKAQEDDHPGFLHLDETRGERTLWTGLPVRIRHCQESGACPAIRIGECQLELPAVRIPGRQGRLVCRRKALPGH